MELNGLGLGRLGHLAFLTSLNLVRKETFNEINETHEIDSMISFFIEANFLFGRLMHLKYSSYF